MNEAGQAFLRYHARHVSPKIPAASHPEVFVLLVLPGRRAPLHSAMPEQQSEEDEGGAQKAAPTDDHEPHFLLLLPPSFLPYCRGRHVSILGRCSSWRRRLSRVATTLQRISIERSLTDGSIHSKALHVVH